MNISSTTTQFVAEITQNYLRFLKYQILESTATTLQVSNFATPTLIQCCSQVHVYRGLWCTMRSYENVFKHKMDDEKFKLPVGFRFHLTDEELINQYLVKKVNDNSFCAIGIADIDMNKCEAWDLAELAKMGETEIPNWSKDKQGH